LIVGAWPLASRVEGVDQLAADALGDEAMQRIALLAANVARPPLESDAESASIPKCGIEGDGSSSAGRRRCLIAGVVREWA
jgi:hypothetical protein